MSISPELEAWLKLALVPGVGEGALRRLLVAFGGPEEVLRASRRRLAEVVPADVAHALHAGTVPPESLHVVSAWLEDPLNRVLTLADSDYPQALLHIADPPPILYVKGRTELLHRPAVAIVGSRNGTQQGLRHAEAFARALSDSGLTIVSGLALGIDAAAHAGGLAGASGSLAVTGTGLDIVYPARNRELAHRLAREGALLSEFALGTPPGARNFPQRNRLISGLSRGCLVVEAAISSGSLITARLASEQGKEVFAIPGSIHSPLAKGCHQLIKQGAKLVESAQDILEELAPGWQVSERPARQPPPCSADARAHALLEHLGHDPCDADTLALRSGLRPEELGALLTQLELEGLIEMLPGGRYRRIT
jgi:DNA processing protein